MATPAWAQFQRTRVGDPSTSTLCATWTGRSFTYTVDAAGSARTPGDSEFVAIDAAFATWQALSDKCSDFQFIKGDRQPNVLVGKGTEDGNVLVFRETECSAVVPSTDPCLADGNACINQYHCWDHGQFTLALTTVTYSTKTGAIYDADIEFNAADWLFTTVSSPPCIEGMETVQCVATDVQNTATHEIGHVMGFDHVNVAGSTMAPTAPVGETSKRIIDPGTGDGFCSTYPRGLPSTPCDMSEVGLRITALSTGSAVSGCASAPGAFAALAVLALLRRRQNTQVT